MRSPRARVLMWIIGPWIAGAVVACDPEASTHGRPESTGPSGPIPSTVGTLTVLVDSTPLVVGRHPRVEVRGVDANGVPFDVAQAELLSTNTSVAQMLNVTPFPITSPPGPIVYALSGTLDLAAPGTTAIRTRIGILVDSIVIVVSAAPSTSVSPPR